MLTNQHHFLVPLSEQWSHGDLLLHQLPNVFLKKPFHFHAKRPSGEPPSRLLGGHRGTVGTVFGGITVTRCRLFPQLKLLRAIMAHLYRNGSESQSNARLLLSRSREAVAWRRTNSFMAEAGAVQRRRRWGGGVSCNLSTCWTALSRTTCVRG